MRGVDPGEAREKGSAEKGVIHGTFTIPLADGAAAPVAPDLRRDIEAELAKALKQIETQENPAGTWILGIGGILLGLVFLIVLLLVLLAYFPPRR